MQLIPGFVMLQNNGLMCGSAKNDTCSGFGHEKGEGLHQEKMQFFLILVIISQGYILTLGHAEIIGPFGYDHAVARILIQADLPVYHLFDLFFKRVIACHRMDPGPFITVQYQAIGSVNMLILQGQYSLIMAAGISSS